MAVWTPRQLREGVNVDHGVGRGYRRSPDLQTQFDAAVARLRAEDSWPPGSGQLRADLALEGGGVKGIGLLGAILVLDEAGYSFRGVAGTSAGAVTAALVAALGAAGEPMTRLIEYMDRFDFRSLQPRGLRHLGEPGWRGRVADLVAGVELLFRSGLSSGVPLEQWLEQILDELGARTFEQLRLRQEDDPEMSLDPTHQYRLVVHTSDVTRKQLVRLPWDFPLYGLDPSTQSVARAIRASMSIPFYFTPVTVGSQPATVQVPTPDGTITVAYRSGTETWVDGGMLRNFPIGAFDRADGRKPRWPTIGIKLSALATEHGTTTAFRSSVGIGRGCLSTMTGEWDTYSVEESTAARTIFVDHGDVRTTQFALTQADKDLLFHNGVCAATQFVIEMGAGGHVPRSAAEGAAYSRAVRRSGGPVGMAPPG